LELLVNRVHWRAVLVLWALSLGACSTRTYDLVVANGRVMDPESGFDRVAHVGIVGNRIAAISDRPLRGTRSIDASGLVVAPGLIELHTHGEDKLNYEFRAMDGVTTMLDTERGTVDVDKWYADRDRKALVNYGISAGHPAARVQVVGGKYEGFHFSGPARTSPATPEQIDQVAALVRRGLARGALGVGLMPFYTPGATEDELTRMFAIAAEVPGAAVYVHLRYAGLGANGQPGAVQALEEVLNLSREAKAPLHVCHITSSGLAATPTLLKMVADAKAHGQDVTTELYPYTAAMSGINSTWFAPGWQQTLAISYDKLQWPKTGEFLTEATFKKYQRENPGDEVIIHAIPAKHARRTGARLRLPGTILGCSFIDERAPDRHQDQRRPPSSAVSEVGQREPCGTGETGRVLVTPLHNYAMPLFRYEIGDYAEVGGRCACGRGLPLLRRILGRERNALLVAPTGERYWPAFGSRKLAQLAPIVQHQFVQKSLDRIEARLVTERPLTRAEERSLRAYIVANLPYRFALDLAYFDEIPRNASGKFEDFVCEVAG
jgi:dihydroorotase